MRTSRGKHAFLFTLELGRRYLGLARIVIMQANVEDEDQPDIAILFETLQTT